MVLIIRTSKRFRGMAWYNDDHAYRREAAASNTWDCTNASMTVCKKQCVTDAIFCENCCEWAHYACENIGEGAFKELSKRLMPVRLL